MSPAQTICQQMTWNLASSMEYFLSAFPRGQIERQPSVSRFAAGREFGAYNAAVFHDYVTDWAAFESGIQETAQFFDRQSLSWNLWLCDTLMPPRSQRRTGLFLRGFGLSRISDATALATNELQPPRRRPPEIAMRRVRSTADTQAFCRVLTAVFAAPPGQLRAVYGSPQLWGSAFRGYLAAYEGFDVSIACTLAAAGLITVYTVGTLPAYTRRGIAEALMRFAIADTKAEVGPLPLAVQTTADSLSLYRRMGFRPTGHFSLYGQT